MSFPRILTAVLCGGFLLLGTAQAQQPGRELRNCKLRLAWWSAPENPPELALQKDKDRTPFSARPLAIAPPWRASDICPSTIDFPSISPGASASSFSVR